MVGAKPMTKQPADIDHLSHSSIRKWLECPRSWAVAYLDERRSRPGVGMLKGKAVDAAATANWDQKRQSGTDIDSTAAQEIAEDAFRHGVDEAGGRGEVDWHNEGFVPALESTVRMTAIHMRDHAPLYQPTATQARLSRRLADGRDFIGYIDAVISPDEVVDVKTAGRRMPQVDADRDMQASAYAFGLGHPVKFTFARVVHSGRSPAYSELVTTQRGAFAIQDYEATAMAVSAAIDGGIFPAHPGYHCAWCPAIETCVNALTQP